MVRINHTTRIVTLAESTAPHRAGIMSWEAVSDSTVSLPLNVSEMSQERMPHLRRTSPSCKSSRRSKAILACDALGVAVRRLPLPGATAR